MRVLGQGGYGVVTLTGPKTARKKQVPHVRDRGVPTASIREIACLVTLRDVPGVPRLKGVHMDDAATLVIDMPRYEATLLDLVRHTPRRRLPVALAKHILHDLFHTLGHMHAHGLMHRDVKPENVMLCARQGAPRVHLIDYGMARFSPSSLASRWTPGVVTIWYRAPEVLLGEPYTFALDVWSAGVVMAELLTGRCPFDGRSEVEQLQRIADVLGVPPEGAFPSTWDRWAAREDGPSRSERRASRALGIDRRDPVGADLLDRLLRWNPSERIRFCDAVAHPWFAEVRGQTARRSPPPEMPLSHLSRLPSIGPRCAASDRRFAWALRVAWKAAYALDLTDGITWYAAMLLSKCVGRVTIDSTLALVCVDLANKMVGVQHVNVLRELGVSDARRSEATVVRDVLRYEMHGFKTPWTRLRQEAELRSLPEPLPSPSSPPASWPQWYVHARAILDAVGLRRVSCFDWSDARWEAAVAVILTVAMAMCGSAHTALSVWARRSRISLSRIATAARHIASAWSEATKAKGSGRLWRKIHSVAARDLEKDAVRASRARRTLGVLAGLVS